MHFYFNRRVKSSIVFVDVKSIETPLSHLSFCIKLYNYRISRHYQIRLHFCCKTFYVLFWILRNSNKSPFYINEPLHHFSLSISFCGVLYLGPANNHFWNHWYIIFFAQQRCLDFDTFFTEFGIKDVEDILYRRVIVFICVCGVLGNLLNLIVLTRKGLQRSMDRMEKSAHVGEYLTVYLINRQCKWINVDQMWEKSNDEKK